MKIIIKQPIDKREWATIFCVGDNACEKGGQLSNAALEKMRSQGIIQVMDPEKLIEKHPKHEELIADSNSHHYLGIGPDEKYPALPTVYKTEFYCDDCVEIIVPVSEHVFEKNYDTGTIKYTTCSRCPKCNDKLSTVFRHFKNEEEAEIGQQELKKLGQTWSKLY